LIALEEVDGLENSSLNAREPFEQKLNPDILRVCVLLENVAVGTPMKRERVRI
jgi:hypothetical protein